MRTKRSAPVRRRAKLETIKGKSMSGTTPAETAPIANTPSDYAPYQPRTRLGKRLCELRSQIVASGAKLLDWDQIEREVAERRESAGRN